MPEPLDYREKKLYINRLPVESLTMVGLLAELVPKLAREKELGASGVSAEHLPDFLCVTLDGFFNQRRVRCHGDDRTLAVEVARAVRVRLCGGKLGLDMVPGGLKPRIPCATFLVKNCPKSNFRKNHQN